MTSKKSIILPMPIVLANKNNNELSIVSELSTSLYPSSIWEPIGIVVIPAEHGVLKDGTGTMNQCGIMSLNIMNCKAPETGSHVYYNESISWGRDELYTKL